MSFLSTLKFKKVHQKLILSPLAFYSFALFGQKAPIQQSKVMRPECEVAFVNTDKALFSKTSKRFNVGTLLKFRSVAGTRMFRKTFPPDSDLIVVADPTKKGNYYLGRHSCLFRKTPTKTAFTSPQKSIPQSTSVEEVSTPSNRYWSAALYFQTFKSKSSVTVPGSKSATLNTQTVGIVPEISLRWKGRSSEWGGGAGLFIGRAEIGRSLSEQQSTELKGFNFQADNVTAMGAELSLFYLFRPSFKNVALGFKVPVRFMNNQWPTPAVGYEVESKTDLSVSFLLEGRLERGDFALIQNIGFYKDLGDILWSLGVGYQF